MALTNFINGSIVNDVIESKKFENSLVISGIKGDIPDNIVTNTTKIVVKEHEGMVVVLDKKVVDYTTDSGEYTSNNIGGSVFYVNLRKIKVKFGTIDPIKYNDMNVRCYGEFIYEVTDMLKFYGCYNESFNDILLDSFMIKLTDIFYSLSSSNILIENLLRESSLINKTSIDLLMSDFVSRGISLLSVNIASITPTVESIKNIEINAVLDNTPQVVVKPHCPNCGTLVEEEMLFCSECGFKL